jgi:hypothetical protein
MKTLVLSAAAIAAISFTSCKKDGSSVSTSPATSKDNSTMAYQMMARNTTTVLPSPQSSGTSQLQWTSGYVNPREIRFEAKSKNTNIEYKSKNASRIDLFATNPVYFGGVAIPAGTYKEIELKTKLEMAGTDPALLLNGVYTNGLNSIPVVFRVMEDLELRSELENVTIVEPTMAAITILNLDDEMSGITTSMLQNALLTNGTIVISREFNRSLYDMILRNLSEKRRKSDYKHKD